MKKKKVLLYYMGLSTYGTGGKDVAFEAEK